MKLYRMQLVDSVQEQAIQNAGGVVYVATNGDTTKVALFNEDGGSISNPVALTNGIINFYTADAINKVDLYIQAPTGHAVVVKNVEPSGPNSIKVDRSRTETVLVVPFSATDSTAASETNTGFDIPTNAIVLPTPFVNITAIDATETIDVGTAAGESGDADGFIAAASVATLGAVKGSVANGALTMGALLFVQDSVNAGDRAPESSVTQSGKSVVYTLSAGSDTAKGFILLPMILPVASL